MNDLRKKITDDVIEVISYIRGSAIKVPPITMNSKVVQDLGLEQDVEDLIYHLQNRTGIKPSSAEWRAAITVEDIINLLLKYKGK